MLYTPLTSDKNDHGTDHTINIMSFLCENPYNNLINYSSFVEL